MPPLKDRILQRLHLAKAIWDSLRVASHPTHLIRIVVSNPVELRGINAENVAEHGWAMPTDLSPDDKAAILTYGGCDQSCFIFMKLLPYMLGEDWQEISWYCIDPVPSRNVWVGTEQENLDNAQSEFFHSYLRLVLNDSTVFAVDFTPEQFGWPFEVMEAGKYDRKYSAPATSPQRVDWLREEAEMPPETFDKLLRDSLLSSVLRLCGHVKPTDDLFAGMFEQSIAKSDETQRALLEEIGQDIRDFCQSFDKERCSVPICQRD
ncbi:hypothetical protein BU16DRAFT_567384 [Lophium mytilinum]|uniref:Uncharacterized protein n=1 Tax=Lophium mytilinum TaxID=390894 RepID=A0A6A6QB36_9PEZI|nr:hypothetical protein BU16DRAFT_567384 [Lophium mytilinum]